MHTISTKIRKIAKKLIVIKSMGGMCERCQETEIATLCCHHKDPSTKSFKVFEKLDSSLTDMLMESSKCTLFCQNCHIEHHNRKPKKQKIKLLDYMGVRSCEKCGYSNDISALHFHHIHNKKFQVSSIHFNCNSDIPDHVKQELQKCEVLCANCHAKEHFDYEFFEEYYKQIIEKSNNYVESPRYDKSQIIPLFRDGASIVEIEEKTKIPRHIITSELSKNNETDFGKKIDIIKLRQLHSEGLNSFEISKLLKKSQASICRCLQRIGLSPNKRKHGNSKINITLPELENKLKSQTLSEVANEFNVSRYAMYKKLQRLKRH